MSCCVFWKLTPRWQHHLQILSPSPHLSFHFVYDILCYAKPFKFKSHLSTFVFISITLANRSKKKYCCYLYQRVLLPIFSSVCAEECPTLCNPLYVQRNVCAEYVQSCPALCNPMDCSPPGCPIHGIFHTRILEQVPISFSRRASQTKDQTCISCVSYTGR